MHQLTLFESAIKPTSRAAFESIKEDRARIQSKILEGMSKLPNGGHFEMIASACGLQPQQVWKRLSELERDQKIFNTGRLLFGMFIKTKNTFFMTDELVNQLTKINPDATIKDLRMKKDIYKVYASQGWIYTCVTSRPEKEIVQILKERFGGQDGFKVFKNRNPITFFTRPKYFFEHDETGEMIYSSKELSEIIGLSLLSVQKRARMNKIDGYSVIINPDWVGHKTYAR